MDETKEPKVKSLFTDVTINAGITFKNELTITPQLNPYTYRNFYNGAGVAIGDINNDGLPDLYFAGNQSSSRLYLNSGNFQFEDITYKAGVSTENVWSTGVTFADVNHDGFLDLYVCKSGNPDAPRRHNELFINNGDLTFSERSKEFGLDVIGLGVQAAFFDYDRDGDLDCYLLTNSLKSISNFNLVVDQRKIRDASGGGNKFLVNENGKFIDRTEQVGIFSSVIGFGLGITLGDFNDDQWTDIFVSNDFFERDYLYINDRKGGFEEALPNYFNSISMGSMGADYADLDNDGRAELFVTEMLPDSLHRKKSKTVYESWNKFQANLDAGYHFQYSRNVLQTRIGNSAFAEVGRYSGVAATEWSWGALLFDMDNDGLRDIFVANGIFKDLLDRDYLTYSASEENIRSIVSTKQDQAILDLLAKMPASKFPNYAFKNSGALKFVNSSREWGFNKPAYSSGAAYADLDNDQDLDLVVSNIDDLPSVYRNESKSPGISFNLSMAGENRFAVGSQIVVYAGSDKFYSDNFVTRGFQSCVSTTVTIGMGEHTLADSVVITWPTGACSKYYRLDAHTVHAIAYANGKQRTVASETPSLPFNFTKVSIEPIRHFGSGLIDFDRDRLLPIMYSNETPSFTRGDIDGDKIDEIYFDRGKGHAGVIIDFDGGKPQLREQKLFSDLQLSEDTRSHFFDADKDGDLDLYVATGGRFFPPSSNVLLDHLLVNDGKGNFTASTEATPLPAFTATSVVKSIDFDQDNDSDLVVGERFDPFVYGSGGRVVILRNDGTGRFSDATREALPQLPRNFMVTDIDVVDFNNDSRMDVVIAGDWMPITFLKNSGGKFEDVSAAYGLAKTRGWWNRVVSHDLNHDGLPDFVFGNHGQNTFFKQSDRMYVGDFDGNGSIEQIFCTKENGKYYPILDKDDLLSQLPSYKRKLLHFTTYAKMSIDELIPAQFLQTAGVFEVDELNSVLLLSSGDRRYQTIPLPKEAQYSPIHAIKIFDFDKDGINDIIAGGNQYLVKPQFGRYDASEGWFFKGTIKDNKYNLNSGISLGVNGQIRDIEIISTKNLTYILFAKHDDEIEIFTIR